jgi:crotonobetainyl-CoA:carnitine CoA-transferase CaiB-like acyl-CoA transferase
MTVNNAAFEHLFERSATGPLAGIVIADFGRVLAGPYCTMLLADLGATVLKVESLAGDETRSWMPPVVDGESTYYMSVNRNKHSIALDFRNEADLAVAKDLAASCDVVVENFKPGGLASFGLDYESVRAINPQVIYASITGFGTAGGVDLPGYDLLVQGAAGLMSLQGRPDTEPFRAGVAVFDVFTGLHACVGILAALRHLSVTGEGQLIELNLMSSALSSMVNQTGAYALAGVTPTRLGNEHPSIYPYAPFPTSDGDIILAIGNDNQYKHYVSVIGAPELALDERFDSNRNRSRNRNELRPLLEAIMVTKSTSEWFDLMRAAGLPSAPINSIKQGMEFAQSLGLEPIVTVGHGDATQPGVRNPVTYSASPVTYDFMPPSLDGSGAAIRAWLASKDS